MQVTSEVVQHVAQLALLHLTDSRKERFTEQLNVILDYALKLYELDVTDVPPTSHALAMTQVLREDVLRPSLSIADTLVNAPEHEEQCFLVPVARE